MRYEQLVVQFNATSLLENTDVALSLGLSELANALQAPAELDGSITDLGYQVLDIVLGRYVTNNVAMSSTAQGHALTAATRLIAARKYFVDNSVFNNGEADSTFIPKSRAP